MVRSAEWPDDGTTGLRGPVGTETTGALESGGLVLHGFELSLDTAPIEALEAATRQLAPELVQEWCSDSPSVEEAALLATCHRVELLLVLPASADVAPWRARLPGSPGDWRVRVGRPVVEHLVEVAAGRRSIAPGEHEVQGQVLAAARGTWSRHPRPLLRDLLRSAAAAANDRPDPPTDRPSIAGVAAELLLERLGGDGTPVAVLGTGTVGRRVTELLARRFSVTVVYRLRPPDPAFLARTGAVAVPSAELPRVLQEARGVVAATSTVEPLVRSSDLVEGRPILLVDLGLPRNIDPRIRERGGAELLDLGDLRRRLRPGIDPLDRERTRRTEEIWERFGAAAMESWVDTFRRAVEEMRRRELVRGRPFLGPLTPEQEQALDLLTRRLVDRILRAPTDRLRALPPGPEGETLRRAALALFRAGDPDP